MRCCCMHCDEMLIRTFFGYRARPLGGVLSAVFAATADGFGEGDEELVVWEHELDLDAAEGDRSAH